MAPNGNDGNDENKIDKELENQGSTQTAERASTKTPSLYSVVLLNDDFTPREFVVHILKKFFSKNDTEATSLMMQVHTKGSGIAGVFTFEIAEMKTHQVNSYARSNQYPLKAVMQEVA